MQSAGVRRIRRRAVAAEADDGGHHRAEEEESQQETSEPARRRENRRGVETSSGGVSRMPIGLTRGGSMTEKSSTRRLQAVKLHRAMEAYGARAEAPITARTFTKS
jgi:hypothetical protein